MYNRNMNRMLGDNREIDKKGFFGEKASKEVIFELEMWYNFGRQRSASLKKEINPYLCCHFIYLNKNFDGG